MFVVLRIAKIGDALLTVTVVGVFAQKVDAQKCERTDRSRSRAGIFGKNVLSNLDLSWRVEGVPHHLSEWQPKASDPVYVLIHGTHAIDCAPTQEALDVLAHQYLSQTPTVGKDCLKSHVLKFGLYRPGVMADVQMQIDLANQGLMSQDLVKNKLIL